MQFTPELIISWLSGERETQNKLKCEIGMTDNSDQAPLSVTLCLCNQHMSTLLRLNLSV